MKEKIFISHIIKKYYINNLLLWIVMLIAFVVTYQYKAYISYLIFFVLIFNVLTEINSRNIEKIILDIQEKKIIFHFFNFRKKWTMSFNIGDIKHIRKQEIFGQGGVSDYIKFNFINSEYLFITQTDFSSEILDEIQNILEQLEKNEPDSADLQSVHRK